MNKVLSKSKLILASPRGFCAGVERAVEILQRAIDLLGAPVYVKHEVVHNKYIIEDLVKYNVLIYIIIFTNIKYFIDVDLCLIINNNN